MKMKRKGFTLIELIVVIAVLAILITLAVPKYLDHVKSANAVALQADLRTVEQAWLQKSADTGSAAAIAVGEVDTDLADQIKSLANDIEQFSVSADGVASYAGTVNCGVEAGVDGYQLSDF